MQSRFQQALERIADGFIYHCRKQQQKSKEYARETVFKDWQRAANNVGKAAQVLQLFIDDSVDQQQSFGIIKQQALKLLCKEDLESVCLFLNGQKRTVDEARWQYYDQKADLREGLLRTLFLCVQFQGSDKTHRLVAAIDRAQKELVAHGHLINAALANRIIGKKQRLFLYDANDAARLDRYEWFLYLQIPGRMNGQLTLPNVIKYRALDADLVNQKRWREDKKALLTRTHIPKLVADPNLTIKQMATELASRLLEVSEYLNQENNRNTLQRSR